MDEQEILSAIKSIINEDLGLNVKIDPDGSLIGSDMLDSMDWISFLTIIEEKFNISISAEEAAKNRLGVVKNLINYLKERST